jgi:hypothetical protein
MPTETKLWACERCGGLFDGVEEAEKCERAHAAVDELSIVEVKFAEGDERFPTGILLESGGAGAVYEIKRIGSIEDFDEANGGW